MVIVTTGTSTVALSGAVAFGIATLCEPPGCSSTDCGVAESAEGDGDAEGEASGDALGEGAGVVRGGGVGGGVA